VGEKIIAKSSKEGIKIHTMFCKALKTISYSSLLEAHRKSEPQSNTYTLHIQLQFFKNKITIVDIIALFSTFSIPIFKFELNNVDEEKMLATIEGEVSNPAKLAFLFADLHKNHAFLEVISKSIT
jgi:(p)ppGpp synthase/HD superfamily hydrolase